MDQGAANGADRRRRSADSDADANEDGLVMRPITSEAALAVARQMLEHGVPGIKEGPDGRLWALGADRRKGDRRGS